MYRLWYNLQGVEKKNIDVLFAAYDSKSDTLIMIYSEKHDKKSIYEHESIYEEMLDKFSAI